MELTLNDIEEVDRDALIRLWTDTIGTQVSKGVSTPLLRRVLAFEVQAQELGGLPAGFRSKLEKAVKTQESGASPALKPGGRYLREWNGVTHVVDVVESGYRWNGTTWRSLSAIAREITGAHWSGPRFFGLTGKTAS